MPDQHEVLIDGVRYVPVSEAHIDARRIEDVIVAQYSGDNWREEYPDSPSYLRVVVGDTFEADEGETVTAFVGRHGAVQQVVCPHGEDQVVAIEPQLHGNRYEHFYDESLRCASVHPNGIRCEQRAGHEDKSDHTNDSDSPWSLRWR